MQNLKITSNSVMNLLYKTVLEVAVNSYWLSVINSY